MTSYTAANSSPQNKALMVESSPPVESVRVDPWELAYTRFETPEQEISKFARRLTKAGARRWPREAEIIDLFCGRSNGLQALSRLGFTQLAGVDLSPTLLQQYSGPAKVYVGDCRQLPFEATCKDIVIVQGGLHHLIHLPDDLEQTLSEIRRVLRPDGLFVVVEPWLTPFLSVVHTVCQYRIARRLSSKIDALATMIHYEQQTYDQWLSQPDVISGLFEKYFYAHRSSTTWGKFAFVGGKK